MSLQEKNKERDEAQLIVYRSISILLRRDEEYVGNTDIICA
ncbi:hypothetical protein THF5H11_10039 [Vibrio jasicida]|nr:hypothetical protein THF5H11_10039 [Vibrio jasicida]